MSVWLGVLVLLGATISYNVYRSELSFLTVRYSIFICSISVKTDLFNSRFFIQLELNIEF